MQDHLQEAERLAEAAGDRRRQGLVAAFLTNFYTVMLELRRASSTDSAPSPSRPT